jgi:hypothetical protein
MVTFLIRRVFLNNWNKEALIPKQLHNEVEQRKGLELLMGLGRDDDIDPTPDRWAGT